MFLEPFINRPLWAALLASTFAQIIKVLLEMLTDKKFNPARLLDTGGMPSAHSAAVAALSTSIGIQEGFRSPLFAISAIFSYLVMYDATGIRRAAGLHAQMINELVQELAHLFDEGFQPQVLKTLLGHTVPQVIIGMLLGILVGAGMYLF
ncbi:MAG: divergent PAP2 family protein [Deinococcales bacterium]